MSRRLPDGVTLLDAHDVFQRTCIEMGRGYARRMRWTRAETDAVVRDLIADFVPSYEGYYEHFEREDADGIVALARQEQTRKLMRMSMSMEVT